ncbi:MAG TPA: protein-tyrosine phosphatase family protein [Candidatus Limnocylindria bacterium]
MAAPALDPPLRVDWLAPEDLSDGLPGRLGMTFLPGKQGASTRYPGRVYRRDLTGDLENLMADGVRHLLLLVDDAELARFGDLQIVERAAAAGLTVIRRPLADGTAPSSVAGMDEMLSVVAAARARADVAVACMGGVGRTGLVVACALVAAGRSTPDAIARVRQVRHPEAVETEAQVRFVDAYERHVADAVPRSGSVAP